ncbi:MAG: DUF1343 domain-containing protein [Bdellovibrionota bacterium]
MQLGIEVLLQDKKLLKYLKTKRVSLVCHPASVDHKLNHSLDLLQGKVKLTSAFGPQHGAKGDKQDNMIETADEIHPHYKIPIFSLYGEVRRPTLKMMDTFDVVLYDLQDLGCRIYTFITTLFYIMQECEKFQKEIIILDRPNPIGRGIEGMILEEGYESFVGAGPIPMRYGLTVGELAMWFKDHFKMNVNLKVVKMKGYSPTKKPGYGWPQDLAWVNPSPNAQTLTMARAYTGTVMIEGTHLSEGRGTTRALEIIGASDIDFPQVLKTMETMGKSWLRGCVLRLCNFEPTFHKHEKKLCSGIQIHTDDAFYNSTQFKPYRIVSLMLKAIKEVHPNYEIFRDFPYEYVTDKLAFDVINGGPKLREWIENRSAKPADLDKILQKDEKRWAKESRKFYLYK